MPLEPKLIRTEPYNGNCDLQISYTIHYFNEKGQEDKNKENRVLNIYYKNNKIGFNFLHFSEQFVAELKKNPAIKFTIEFFRGANVLEIERTDNTDILKQIINIWASCDPFIKENVNTLLADIKIIKKAQTNSESDQVDVTPSPRLSTVGSTTQTLSTLNQSSPKPQQTPVKATSAVTATAIPALSQSSAKPQASESRQTIPSGKAATPITATAAPALSTLNQASAEPQSTQTELIRTVSSDGDLKISYASGNNDILTINPKQNKFKIVVLDSSQEFIAKLKKIPVGDNYRLESKAKKSILTLENIADKTTLDQVIRTLALYNSLVKENIDSILADVGIAKKARTLAHDYIRQIQGKTNSKSEVSNLIQKLLDVNSGLLVEDPELQKIIIKGLSAVPTELLQEPLAAAIKDKKQQNVDLLYTVMCNNAVPFKGIQGDVNTLVALAKIIKEKNNKIDKLEFDNSQLRLATSLAARKKGPLLGNSSESAPGKPSQPAPESDAKAEGLNNN